MFISNFVNFTLVVSQWPELPADFGCPGRFWDRAIAGYISDFNAKILENQLEYQDPRFHSLNGQDFIDAVKFPEAENTWSWGTWGAWGEWNTQCARLIGRYTNCRVFHRFWEKSLFSINKSHKFYFPTNCFVIVFCPLTLLNLNLVCFSR